MKEANQSINLIPDAGCVSIRHLTRFPGIRFEKAGFKIASKTYYLAQPYMDKLVINKFTPGEKN